ncbi:MAG TPA: hypothetical protein VFK05_16420 [Polyangiaceae bacterium]|nr:hypothetical protein [Polyangiaceae bacterium]
MAAIAEELVFREHSRPKPADDTPEVSLTVGPAGRETLAAIERAARPARARMATLDYGDRISNAPGAKTPSRTPGPPKEPTAKEPAQHQRPAARQKPAVHQKPASPPEPAPHVVAPTIFEMLTFVVQSVDVSSLASESQRRRFVEAHLLQRLPGRDMSCVERVDVTPWTVKETLVVRVWCKV